MFDIGIRNSSQMDILTKKQQDLNEGDVFSAKDSSLAQAQHRWSYPPSKTLQSVMHRDDFRWTLIPTVSLALLVLFVR